MPKCSEEREMRVTALLDLASATGGLKLQKEFYSIPTNMEKFCDLYESQLSSENPTYIKSYTYI